MQDAIDRAYETTGNPLDEIARAEFRRGVEYAIGIIQKYRADPQNLGTPGSVGCVSFTSGVKSACSGILSDLSE